MYRCCLFGVVVAVAVFSFWKKKLGGWGVFMVFYYGVGTFFFSLFVVFWVCFFSSVCLFAVVFLLVFCLFLLSIYYNKYNKIFAPS